MIKFKKMLQAIVNNFKQDNFDGMLQEIEKVRGQLVQHIKALLDENTKLKKKLDEQVGEHEIIKQKPEVSPEKEADRSLIEAGINLYKEENQLILNNMFLVQEELEKQLNENNRLKLVGQQYESRLDKLKKNYPYILEHESISITSCDQASEEPFIEFEIHDAVLRNDYQVNLKFKFLLNGSSTGIKIFANSSEQSLNKAYTLIPNLILGDKTSYRDFLKLRTLDWEAYQFATHLLKDFVENGWKGFVPNQIDQFFWTSCFMKFIKDFERLPAAFRFDEVQLKNQQINQDYEHLWFELSNVSFGNLRLPEFEFRLSAANIQVVKKDIFSEYPKLEVPLIKNINKPFPSWFAESHDDFGEKFELRFDLRSQRFDLKVWDRLSIDDAHLMFGLILILPLVLSRINKNTSLSHSVKDWIKLSGEMHKVLKLRLSNQP
jgi:hypothetical protein